MQVQAPDERQREVLRVRRVGQSLLSAYQIIRPLTIALLMPQTRPLLKDVWDVWRGVSHGHLLASLR